MGRTLSIGAGDTRRLVQLDDQGSIVVDGTPFQVTSPAAPEELIVSNGTAVERTYVLVADGAAWVFHDGDTFELSVEAEGSVRRRPQHHGSLTAPMPATVIGVNVRPGDRVTSGSVLIVLEAMKMELPVRAPSDGTVVSVNCRAGDLVQAGVPLIELQ